MILLLYRTLLLYLARSHLSLHFPTNYFVFITYDTYIFVASWVELNSQ